YCNLSNLHLSYSFHNIRNLWCNAPQYWYSNTHSTFHSNAADSDLVYSCRFRCYKIANCRYRQYKLLKDCKFYWLLTDFHLRDRSMPDMFFRSHQRPKLLTTFLRSQKSPVKNKNLIWRKHDQCSRLNTDWIIFRLIQKCY